MRAAMIVRAILVLARIFRRLAGCSIHFGECNSRNSLRRTRPSTAIEAVPPVKYYALGAVLLGVAV